MWKKICSALFAGLILATSVPAYAAEQDVSTPAPTGVTIADAVEAGGQIAVPLIEESDVESMLASGNAETRGISLSTSGLNSISGYDYVIDASKMVRGNMQMSTSMTGWYLKWVSSGRYVLAYDYPNGYKGKAPYSGYIVLRFPDAIKDGGGNRYDLVLTMANIWINATTTTTSHYLIDIYDDPRLESSPMWVYGDPGTRCNITYQVMARGTNTPVDGKLLLSFADLDQPGADSAGRRFYGNADSYTESVRLESGVMSPVYLEPNHVLSIQNGNKDFVATRNTDSPEEIRSAIAYLGDAKGTNVMFSLMYAGTSVLPTVMDNFQQYTATTYVRYQQKDGSWGGWSVANSQKVTSGMSYWYTWSHSAAGVSSAVYGTPSNATVGTNGVKSNQDFYISVPRNQYTYSFKSNDPNGEAVSGMPSSITKYAENAIGNVVAPTSKNFLFSGWNTKADGTGSKLSASEQMLSNKTFYAQWAPKEYKLTYDKNSPTTASVGDSDVVLSKESQTAKYGSSWGELATATKPGYIFDGWWTAENGGSRIDSSTKVTGNLTVYAHWRPIEYTIRFHPNAENGEGEVTGSMPSVKMTYDKALELPENQYRKTTITPPEDDGGEAVENQSTFKGWNRNPLSLDIGYADKAKVMNLTATDGEFIDLYAIWDDAPNFMIAEYPDRFFTLEEAQGGFITEEELLKTVKVYDRETHELPKKTTEDVETGDDIGVTIVGYDEDEWKSLTDDSTVSVRYQVKDEAGHKTYLNIRVTVTRNGALPKEEVEYYRSISDEYRGGLADLSRWRIDETYSSKLDDAFSGSAKTHSLYVGADELDTVRDYVKDNGMGNSRDGNALSRLFDLLFG